MCLPYSRICERSSQHQVYEESWLRTSNAPTYQVRVDCDVVYSVCDRRSLCHRRNCLPAFGRQTRPHDSRVGYNSPQLTVRYNHYAELWNSTYLDEYRNSSFSIQVNSRTVVPTPNTTASGAYYPYRDACSSKKDPPCLQVPVFFWSAEVDEKQDPEVIIAVSNSTHSIPRIRHWSLTKKEISCEGGSQSSSLPSLP